MISTNILLAIVTVLSPLAAFAVISGFLLRTKWTARLVSLSAMLVSLVCSSWLLWQVGSPQYREVWSFEWLMLGETAFTLGVLLDPLSLIMLWVVAVVGFLVQWYSFSYMDHDERQAKFFAFISLFCFAMMGFTVAPNLFQSYMCWELVGLGSYLLIGFWYQLPSAATAARKAFVMTRLGDLGFFAAILITFVLCGSVDFGALAGEGAKTTWLLPFAGADVAMWVSIGLFMAVAGKSAQFPLYGWLPDAMEGPTPVSALIHAATMVAAGVYLLARNSFLMSAGSELTVSAWHIMAGVAMLTALMSGAVAVVQSDIKRVLAYSTISQLGYMITGICTGAVVAGMMHLFTHAFFKALLFLAAGAFIHAAHSNTITDIARAGGRKMKLAMISLAAGSLALAGIFPFAGFYSKDAILEHLLVEGHYILFGAALVGVLLTSYYMFRVVFLMLKTEPEPGTHLHTGSWMVLPLAVLTIGAAFAGNVWNYASAHWFHVAHAEHSTAVMMTITLSTLSALAGIGYAARVFYFKRAADPAGLLPNFARVLREKWYLDWSYEKIVHGFYLPFTKVLRNFEIAQVKGALDGIGSSCMNTARAFSRLQSGELQQYLGLIFAAVAVVLFVLYNG